MPSLISPAQRAAGALRRAERALRNWQDDPASPRNDVDKMIAIVADLRTWVQGHLLLDIEKSLAKEASDHDHRSDGPLPS